MQPLEIDLKKLAEKKLANVITVEMFLLLNRLPIYRKLILVKLANKKSC